MPTTLSNNFKPIIRTMPRVSLSWWKSITAALTSRGLAPFSPLKQRHIFWATCVDG
jgi:hypothetical protein